MRYQILSHIDILKPTSGSDCTNNGLSSKHHYATLLVPETISDGLHEPIKLLGGLKDLSSIALSTFDCLLILKKRILFDTPYFHVEPFPFDDKPHGYMFGGNFINYSGNGFKSITGYPLAIHDREE